MVIYKITNKVNGLSYIGQTINSFKKRWGEHCSKASNKTYIDRAIKKYGKENFKTSIIKHCNNIQDLNQEEKNYILQENTLYPNGYNLKIGGNNGPLTEYVKNRIKEGMKGMKRKPLSKERKSEIALKQSKAMMGKNTWMKGKKHKESSKLKVSLALKGTRTGKDNPMYGKVGANKGKTFREEYKERLATAHGSRPFYLMSLNGNII